MKSIQAHAGCVSLPYERAKVIDGANTIAEAGRTTKKRWSHLQIQIFALLKAVYRYVYKILSECRDG